MKKKACKFIISSIRSSAYDGNIFYEYEEIEKLVNFIILNKNNKKKKGFIEIFDNLMVNNSGYLCE